MSVQFSEIVVSNNNGVEIEVLLEVPVGTSITGGKIGPSKSRSFPVNQKDVQTTKITVIAYAHEDYPDVKSFDTTDANKPQIYIETINVFTSIGIIHGTISQSVPF